MGFSNSSTHPKIREGYFSATEMPCAAASNWLAAASELVQPDVSGPARRGMPITTAPATARCGRTTMSSITADGLAAPAGPVDGEVGPLEQKHLQNANYRAVAGGGGEITKTHWHIAAANALGWGFDGMDGVIFALVSPMVIKEFSLTVPEYRSGLQIALFVGIAGLYFWPWLSDRLGRRSLLAINIALFSL